MEFTLVPDRLSERLGTLAPGLGLVAVVSASALAAAALEGRVLGRPLVEGLVIAILLGLAVRTTWTLPATCEVGIRFAAKELLEIAVCLLGLAVDLPLLLRAGPALVVGIVLLVFVAIGLSYTLGRGIGLPHKLAVLVACGNAICGNSAIAAIAPIIDADAEHVTSAIAFTAILGVLVVLGLPLLIRPLELSLYQYGVLAGLTVYAVPQVLAAAFSVSALSGQIGTLVKLVRVLMLGPVVLFFALRQRASSSRQATTEPFRIGKFVPWFIVGFLLLACARFIGLVPAFLIEPVRLLSAWLTVAAMAALGLSCDLRTIARAGIRVVLTVSGSLLILIALSVGLIRELGIQ